MTGFLKGMAGHQRVNPISDEWLTPPEIIKALGPFDMDPCATSTQAYGSKPWRTAKLMLCKKDNGLQQTWCGFVWLNPPYGKAIGAWMAKMAKHGDGIALVFARTETGWFQDSVFKTATSLYFLMGYGTEATHRLATLQMPGKLIHLR